MSSVYLLDIEAVDADGDPLVIRIGTCGYVTSPMDVPANTTYLNAISDPGDFTVSIFGDGQTMGQAHAGYGNITVVNVDGFFDSWVEADGPKLDGRRYTLRRLDDASSSYSTAEIVATGVVDSLRTNSGLRSLEIAIFDRFKELDQPLQTTRYAGTTTSGAMAQAEGNEDLKDQVKPLCFGTNINIPGVPANVYDPMYQFSDGPVTDIVFYDGRVPMTLGGSYATLGTLLTALTTDAGLKIAEWGKSLSLGIAAFRASSDYPVTADITEGSSSKPGAVSRRILERFGLVAGTDFEDGDFTGLDDAAPYDVGVYVDDDASCATCLASILDSVGGWCVPDALGVLHAGRFVGPETSVGDIGPYDLVGDDISLVMNPDTNGIPVWRAVVNWGPIGLVQDGSQVAKCITDEAKAFVASEWRQVISEDQDIRDEVHPQAGELTVNARVVNQADAAEIADHLLALYGTTRHALRVSVQRSDSIFDLGQTVTITLPRLGFETGRDMVLIGKTDRRRDGVVDLTFWG